MDAAHVPLRIRIGVILLVVIPFLGLAAALILLAGAEFYWYYLMVFGSMYAITTLGIGVGFHRLFTHRSFETFSFVRFILAVMGSMSVEGPVLKWVAQHRLHHQHTDKPGDPHSPHLHHHDDESSFLGLLKGAWHAHIGWIQDPDSPTLDRFVPDLRKDPVVTFVSRTWVLWTALGLLIPAVVAGILTGSWVGFWLGMLWGGLARVFFVHHVTWSINSICHLWGSRPFQTGDESRDNPIFGILAFGEGWHNAHHAFPSSARHGLAWWKLDINYLAIRLLGFLRLAWNIRRPTPQKLESQRRSTAQTATPSAATSAPQH